MWGRLFERLLTRLIRHGGLSMTMPDGRTARFGAGGSSVPQIAVTLTGDDTVRRLVTNPHLALGEAYMDGRLTIENDDLHGFLELVMRNIAATGKDEVTRVQQWLRDATRGITQRNRAARSRSNVAHHYDLSAELYDLFLDMDRQYSCAYFRDPSDSLDQAQAQKKAHIAAKLRLRPGMTVLDIGCGWGGMALTLARDHGADVLGVTLSEEQIKIARQRAEAAGLVDRVRFELIDYRAVQGQFDRIVSVGMFEHVGAPQFQTYFNTVNRLLTDDGLALIHTIGRTTPPGSTNPWITKYIFPGGYIPALSEVMACIERTPLVQTDIEIWRLHYAMTLRHWHDRFMARADEAARLYDERFVRMWKFYLVASELTFRHWGHVVFQLQLSRCLDAVPLTRDYLYTG
jgi:cyclopropane-fatty-acyl-phospholipid synthase